MFFCDSEFLRVQNRAINMEKGKLVECGWVAGYKLQAASRKLQAAGCDLRVA